MTLESTLLQACRDADGAHHHLQQIVFGRRWLLAIVGAPDGSRLGGLASRPLLAAGQSDAGQRLQSPPLPCPALESAQLIVSHDPLRAAIGLATINAILNPPYTDRTAADGVDWLLTAGRGRHVALVGRFPFIEDELRPVAGELSVFELSPRPGELGADAMPEVLPRADIVAVAASTLINHTLAPILQYRGTAEVLLLGPSTPLCPALFDRGLDRLSGVAVRDLDQTIREVEAGLSFRRMSGTVRITLARDKSCGPT